MVYCVNCGANIDDSLETCPSCGAGASANPNDAQQNKTMAIIAYILFFIPLLTGDHRKSPFVKFHTNQGTVLFLISMAAQIVSGILVFLVIGCFLWPLFSLVSLILCILGIINAANGEMKPLPIIGKMTIIK
ncbi:MAG: DUF4870 domain-containing protein [Holophagales bacterium]|jgi:uncharacterized membrane protein|nr:DUF4870 domain-containing protein [Holophagales bacterium]